MQRLKTRVQFQAVMAGRTIVSKTAHFALHRMELDAPPVAPTEIYTRSIVGSVRCV